jgi:biotin transport system permease protein
MRSTLGLYQPGDSWLHRLPAGAKLLGLVLVGAASIIVQRWLPVLGGLGLLIVLGYLSAGLGLRTMWKQLKPTFILLLVIGAMQLIATRWHDAVAVPGMLACLVLLAALVTLTTRTSELVEVIVRLASPLRRFGVDPDRIGLFLLLGIRCVPVVAGLAGQVREAQLARGGRFDVRAFAVPLIVSALREADALGEALQARGFDD